MIPAEKVTNVLKVFVAEDHPFLSLPSQSGGLVIVEKKKFSLYALECVDSSPDKTYSLLKALGFVVRG